MEAEKTIIEIIEKLRPYLIGDGGDIEFVKYENNIVYVRLTGACAHCHMIDVTLKDGIESAIQFEVPEVLEVINVGGMDIDDM
jgi:Fe-S cluster biogenesis protein NfuA